MPVFESWFTSQESAFSGPQDVVLCFVSSLPQCSSARILLYETHVLPIEPLLRCRSTHRQQPGRARGKIPHRETAGVAAKIGAGPVVRDVPGALQWKLQTRWRIFPVEKTHHQFLGQTYEADLQ